MHGALLIAASFVFILNLAAGTVDFVSSMIPNSQLAVVAGPGTTPRTEPPKKETCKRGHTYEVVVDERTGEVSTKDRGIDAPYRDVCEKYEMFKKTCKEQSLDCGEYEKYSKYCPGTARFRYEVRLKEGSRIITQTCPEGADMTVARQALVDKGSGIAAEEQKYIDSYKPDRELTPEYLAELNRTPTAPAPSPGTLSDCSIFSSEPCGPSTGGFKNQDPQYRVDPRVALDRLARGPENRPPPTTFGDDYDVGSQRSLVPPTRFPGEQDAIIHDEDAIRARSARFPEQTEQDTLEAARRAAQLRDEEAWLKSGYAPVQVSPENWDAVHDDLQRRLREAKDPVSIGQVAALGDSIQIVGNSPEAEKARDQLKRFVADADERAAGAPISPAITERRGIWEYFRRVDAQEFERAVELGLTTRETRAASTKPEDEVQRLPTQPEDVGKGIRIGDEEKGNLFAMRVGQDCPPPYTSCSESPSARVEPPRELDWKAVSDTRTAITQDEMDKKREDILNRGIALLNSNNKEDLERFNVAAELKRLDEKYYVPAESTAAIASSRDEVARADEEARIKMAALETQAKQDKFETMISQNIDNEDVSSGAALRERLAAAEARDAQEARAREIALQGQELPTRSAQPVLTEEQRMAKEAATNNNFGYPIDTRAGPEQCVDAGDRSACSTAYVEFVKEESRRRIFGGTAPLNELGPAVMASPRAERERTSPIPPAFSYDNLTTLPGLGPPVKYVWDNAPYAYEAAKGQVTGWYEELRVALTPTPPLTFGERAGDAFALNQGNPDNAVSEQLLREGQRRFAEAPLYEPSPPVLAASREETRFPITSSEQAEFERGPKESKYKPEANQYMFDYYIYVWTPYRFKQTMQWLGF